FIQDSLKVLEESFPGENLELDHIKLKVIDREDFAQANEQAKQFATLLVELPHAGRRIAIYKLNEPIKINNYTLEKLVVAETKPGEKLAQRYWDHLSFFVPNFDSFIEKYTEKGIKFHEFRAIGTARFTNVNFEDISLQFRNKKFGEDS